ncbi:MAG: serine hydrolase [Henriciella sp.]|jgi:CubicO group peptidase (beta-lactamase class C family)|uniref:serine hydrolase domain-containing protein n=1 Tax=Henriciella sp. TaxID=1968823 RepID=UPI000C0CCBEF|nr:serine hydrolase [Henriciella sp.]MBF33877.1 serine hydrolase [Hyphomonadaceae bacterium]MBK76877.1 serine hydrolase [Henriciella sp.]PHR79759.1 MAG: serine hydrolase [Henriciella sp.]|tara:strand:+ start:100 stop:1263 length:1164 start_codon:yes stop_codon:yes gene_type:complete
MLFKSLLVSVLCAMGLQASAQDLVPLPTQPEGLAWPTESWPEGELPEETRDDLQLLVQEAMNRDQGQEMGKTRAIVIIHEGRLVFEAYAENFGPDTKQVSWSMAKSITSALAGRAVMLGLIEDIDTPMPSPFAADDPRSEITWRQWLTMTDGLDYLEIGSTGLMDNDVVQMMYGPGRFDVAQHIVDEFELAHDPGAVWNYSTAGFHLIARALQEVTGAEDEAGFARTMDEMLFEPIGMEAVPEFDAAGTFLGGSLVWASARDFAKFGYLYLRGGVWQGERLLPEGWVDFSRRDPASTKANVYGAGWWLGADPDPVPEGQAATTPPFDAFSAQGHEGQTIWVVPSKDLVIVRLGIMPNGGNNWPALYEWNQSIARLFPDAEPEVSSAP